MNTFGWEIKLNWYDRDQIPAELYRHANGEFGYDSESDGDSMYSSEEPDLDSDKFCCVPAIILIKLSNF